MKKHGQNFVRISASTVLLVAASLLLANCSKEDFSKTASNAVVSSTKPSAPAPTSTPLPAAPLVQPPTVTLSSLPCTSGTLCTMDADLNAPLNENLTAQWSTDNTIYEQGAPQGVVYSIPNVDYVPTAGVINFPAGATHTTITVWTLVDSAASLGITRSIVVEFSNCYYSGIEYTCTSLGM